MNHATKINGKIGKTINNYKIIKDSGKRSSSKQIIYEVECLVCHKHFFLRSYDIEHETRWNTKEYLCPHIRITKLGGYNDVYGFTNKNAPKINHRIYSLWQDILKRTSPEFWKKYPTYEGTTMDPRWRTLSIFIEEIKQVEGYEKWLNGKPKEYILDKDLKSPVRPASYSKDTCCFITWKESYDEINIRKPNFLKEKEKEGRKKIQKEQGDKIKLTNLITNEVKYFPSRVTASRWLEKNDSYITSVLSNNKKLNKEALGWKIESISLKEYEEAIKELPKQIFEEKPTKMSIPKVHPKEIIQGEFNSKNYKKITNRTDNFEIPFILNNYPLLSMSQKIVYSMILYYLENGEKTTTVSANKMSVDFNMARGTINQNLRFLAENGFIKIEYFGDANNTREITLLKDIREHQPEWDE